MEYVWKALSDKSRRKILDVLREKAATTGDICKRFRKLSRYAVMKHLTVLEKAELIIIKRKGKYRWNYINPVPIQKIYERWVKKYEANWSSTLLQFKDFAESKNSSNQMEKLTTTTIAELEVKINSTIKEVWKAFTAETTKWWRKDFYTNPNTKQFILEAKVTGKIFEDFGDGEGAVWYTINAIKSPEYIEMAGYIPTSTGGLSISYVKITFESAGNETIIRIKDTVTGEVMNKEEEIKCGKHYLTGWTMLIKESFKQYVENKK